MSNAIRKHRKHVVGERTLSRRKVPTGYCIERVTETLAYAKSGNGHNPTPRFRWEVYRVGALIGTRGTERAAVALANDDAAAVAAEPPIVIEVELQYIDGRPKLGDAHVVQGPAAVTALDSRSLLDLTVLLAVAGDSFTVRPVAIRKSQKGT